MTWELPLSQRHHCEVRIEGQMGQRGISAGPLPAGPSFITGVGRLELGIPIFRLAQALRARGGLALTISRAFHRAISGR